MWPQASLLLSHLQRLHWYSRLDYKTPGPNMLFLLVTFHIQANNLWGLWEVDNLNKWSKWLIKSHMDWINYTRCDSAYLQFKNLETEAERWLKSYPQVYIQIETCLGFVRACLEKIKVNEQMTLSRLPGSKRQSYKITTACKRINTFQETTSDQGYLAHL